MNNSRKLQRTMRRTTRAFERAAVAMTQIGEGMRTLRRNRVARMFSEDWTDAEAELRRIETRGA